MKTFILILFASIVMLVQVQSVQAKDDSPARKNHCSNLDKLVGTWAFATDVGHENRFFFNDVTAIGTFHLSRNGDVEGVFDVTVDKMFFAPDQTFTGKMTVGDNCRGTLNFVTSTGPERTDSIIILDREHFWGMSQDPANLWTYKARRLTR